MQTIYAADDERDIRELLGMFLRDAGFSLRLFETGDELLAAFLEQPCDLVILDVMMPGLEGTAVCAAIRARSRVPVILLTARDSELDHARGYCAGGDDYITKPFRPSILVMKIKALLRRGNGEEDSSLACGDLRYSGLRKQAACRGQDLRLTLTELKLLAHLMARCGNAQSRDALLEAVWDFNEPVETRVVDETVRRVRNKLTLAGSSAHIHTVWGYGYRLEAGEGAE